MSAINQITVGNTTYDVEDLLSRPILTLSQYTALEAQSLIDPNKDYHISDSDLTAVPVNDSVVSPTSVWSSQKTSNTKLGFPDYSQAISIVDAVNTLLDYTPTNSGYLWIVTNTTQILASSLLEDGEVCGTIMNSVLCPVRAGHRYTTNVGIRQARFIPFV